MRHILIFSLLLTLVCGLSACGKTDNKAVEEKPAFDIAPQRAQLQKAKDLEKKMQEDAENQRKVIELQTNPK
ncbi:hypothetical protein [Solimicrobium silvestre]|uniref:Lipoprotein n=1 Tax=Solimicrobium silvestre TaxID=2099400 RepID=A0A2S9GVI9_9BURK|nr:hypothetical protein [Solimicrobium silvestre]PRC91676.1 hypothetical protein S2091_3614 [Solimicrobium silvestre]